MANLGLNVAMSLGFNGVVVKAQPPDPDSADQTNTTGQDCSANMEDPLGRGVEVAVMTAPMTKVERVDLGYGDASAENGNVITYSQSQDMQPPSDEQPAMSDDDYVVMYNDVDESEQPQRFQENGEMHETGEPSQSQPAAGMDFTPVTEQSTDAPSLSPRTDCPSIDENHQTSHAPPDSEAGVSQEVNTCDEIRVVEEMADGFEDGEPVKDYDQSHHGTSSETFLSQMHFFGGRTWARGRGRGRGGGRGGSKQKVLTDIALSLIESDQQDDVNLNGEQVKSAEEKNEATPAMREDEIKSPSTSSQTTSLGTEESKEAYASQCTRGRGSVSKSTPSRGKGRGGKGSRGKGITKSKTRLSAASTKDAVDDNGYMSNEEDTIAAIQASLKDIQKMGHDNSDKTKVMSKKVKKGCNKMQSKAKKGARPPSSKPVESANTASVSADLNETYESDDEDTKAAIKASLEEMKKAPNQKEVKTKKGKESALPSSISKSKTTKRTGKESLLSSPADEVSNTSELYKSDHKQPKSKLKSKGRPKGSCSKFKQLQSQKVVHNKESDDHGLQSARQISSTDVTKMKKFHSTKSKQEGNHGFGRSMRSSSPTPATSMENRKDHSLSPDTEISDFDNVVSAFLHESNNESPLSPSERRKRRRLRKGSFNAAAETYDDEKECTPGLSAVMDSGITPFVKLKKLKQDVELSSSPRSSRSGSLTPGYKRPHSISGDELHAGPSKKKMPENSRSRVPSGSTQHPGSSVVDTPAMLESAESVKAKDQEQSLTKSVGGMMSYLFGDKLAEECPNGFVVNVRLEVDKKNSAEDSVDSANNQGVCCKGNKPELCPCLQKVSEGKLAAVLKERVERRRDLTVGVKGSLLAAILNFMQELDSASSSS